MRSTVQWYVRRTAASVLVRVLSVLLCGCFGCNGLLGLSDYTVRTDAGDLEPAATCGTSVAQCRSSSSADALRACEAARCEPSLSSEDCRVLNGPIDDENALRIGTLFATGGALSSESLARQRAALLAVNEINEAGGVTAPNGESGRPLVLIGCDASRDHKRAAEHLASLQVAAIIGPESSQAMLELATTVTVPAGILMISPVAIASNLTELQDEDLTWLMAPTAKQRAPLIAAQLDKLVERLSASRMHALHLGVVFREDTFGRAALSTLLGLPVDGMSLVQRGAANMGPRVEGYSSKTGFDPSGLVDTFVTESPDAMLLIGLTELVNGFIAPLEERWGKSPGMADAPRPIYVMTDGVRVPDLLALADARPDLVPRLFGTAFMPTGDSRAIYESFRASLRTHFPSTLTDVHGVAATYDTVYSLAYALASLPHSEVRGAKLALALHERLSGTDPVPVGRDGLVAAFRQLSGGGRIHAIGASGPLGWDATGARSEGSVQIYCVGARSTGSYFGEAGVGLDVATGKLSGEFGDCRSGSARPSAGHAEADNADAGAMPTPPSAPGVSQNQSGSAAVTPMGPSPSAGPSSAVQANATLVHCGNADCNPDAKQLCCIADLRLQSGGPRTEDYSCGSASSGCAAELHCGADSMCGAGLICCGSGSSAACSSGVLCELRLGSHLGCTAQRDCKNGDVCCAKPCIPGPAGYCDLSCESSCDSGLGASAVCERDADCAAGLMCRTNPAWLGVKVCQL